MRFGSFVIIFVLISYYNVVDSYRIVGIFTTPIKSHMETYMRIVNGLLDRGHNVTFVTTLPVKVPDKTHRHIYLDMPEYRERFLKLTKELQQNQTVFVALDVFKFLMEQSAACIKQEAMRNLMKEKQSFDLVLFGYIFNEAQFGIAAHFKSPIVLVWVNQLIPTIGKLIGNPIEVSYVPSLYIGAKQPMSFSKKVANYLLSFVDIFRDRLLYHYSKNYYEEIFSKELYPSYDEIITNVSLLLYNHHFSQKLISPLVPAAVEIGGIQVKEKPDPLPKNLQEFLDNASPSGAIYFSLGTSVSSSELGEKAKSIFKVLSSLPQKVIWKWEIEELPGSSSNILFSKWLPQDDILAHPNLRLFITHGGLGSITEARYHGVPVVGIPFFGDQYSNVGAVKEAGWGREVNFLTLNEVNFREAIIDVLSDSKYTENVKRMSKIYRDRPMSPLKTAMFWIEYVIRHNGAPHMQSPAVHMNFISYYSLDVLALIFGSLYIFLKISKLVVRVIWSKLVNLRQIKTKSD